jgi:serine/threonine protein phosphatase 1
MSFAGLFQRKEAPVARFVDGRLGFAVGDIHGRSDLLLRMLERLDQETAGEDGEGGEAGETGEAPILVFLGDYVDRGPDSAGVIQTLIERGEAGGEDVRFLKGNHEQAMLAFLDDPLANRAWLAHGGLDTLASYGVHPLPAIAAPDHQIAAAGEQFRDIIPADHLEFLQGLEKFVVLGDYLFVHAGVDCSRKLGDQEEKDLFWARERFIGDRRRFSHFVVHGHTPVETPFADHRRICIDTGAYATGRLTAARFEDDRVSAMMINLDEDGGPGAYWASLK